MSGRQLVKGYRAIRVPLIPSGTVEHYLFLKEHNDKGQKGGVLFVGNIDCTPQMSQEDINTFLRTLFGGFGDIDAVSLSELGRGMADKARFAHVIFTKKNAVKLALNTKDEDYAELVKQASKSIGLWKEVKITNSSHVRAMFPLFDVDARELQEEVDSYMRDFDEEEKAKQEEIDAVANVPDEDGFITVSTKKRKRGAADLEDSHSIAVKKMNQKKANKPELKNFYRFQIREEKVKQLDQLRKKFEEDKKKVEKMKATRKFNPF